MEYLHLNFNPSAKTFICRSIADPATMIQSENDFLITIFLDAKESNEHYQKIPQAKVALRIVPGYGTTNVQFYDLVEKSTNPIASKQIYRRSIPGTPNYIEETLNSRMAAIISRDEAVDNLALIIDLKKENLELSEKVNSLTDKLSKVAEIIKN